MTLEEFKKAAGGLKGVGHTELVRLFGWWLHVHGGKDYFQPADIGKCYETLHLVPPAKFGGYVGPLTDKGDLIKNRDGYRLAGHVRDSLQATYGESERTVQITQLLAGLPAKLPTLAEKTYLEEAYTCYRHEAYRAAVVMAWNLAYAHLCDHIVRNKLTEFNDRWQNFYKGDHKNGLRAIKVVTDFADEELGENKVLKICLDAGIITKNVYNTMEPALKRRNQAAHPNDVSIKQLHVDSFIDDLVTNAVLHIV